MIWAKYVAPKKMSTARYKHKTQARFVGRVKDCVCSWFTKLVLQVVKNFLVGSLCPHIMLREFLPLRMITGNLCLSLSSSSRFVTTLISNSWLICLGPKVIENCFFFGVLNLWARRIVREHMFAQLTQLHMDIIITINTLPQKNVTFWTQSGPKQMVLVL